MLVTLRTYCPYGQRQNQASQALMLGFNGELYDPLFRSYTLGQGYCDYNPALMRVVAPDGLSPFAEGGTNAYAHWAGDPINNVTHRACHCEQDATLIPNHLNISV